MTVTIGYEAEWAHLGQADTVASHRSTTSSRHPGVQFKGTVRHERLQLTPCACGGVRMGSGAHSPHWVTREGRHLQVDCMGVEVVRAEVAPRGDGGVKGGVEADSSIPSHRAPVVAPELARVADNIGETIVEWFLCRAPGDTFHADDLREFVTRRCGPTAPGSADRVMRSLKQEGIIGYRCIDRSRSLYAVTEDQPEGTNHEP